MRHTFEEIKVTVYKTATCPICGRRTRRSRTFAQTISPFNRHADGIQRTRREVRAAVQATAQAWKRDPDGTHDRCLQTAAATNRSES